MLYLHNNFNNIRENLVYSLLVGFDEALNTIRFFESINNYITEFNLLYPTDNNIDLIFCHLFNSKDKKFADVMHNKIQPNFDSFSKNKKRIKVIVSESLCYYDPQLFWEDISKEILLDEKAIALGVQTEELDSYLTSTSWGKNAFQAKLNAIHRELSKYNPNLIVLRVKNYQIYKQAGLLNDSRFLFVPCDILVDDVYLDPSLPRAYDSVLNGVYNPKIFPYHYVYKQSIGSYKDVNTLDTWGDYLTYTRDKNDSLNLFLGKSKEDQMADYYDFNLMNLTKDMNYQQSYYAQLRNCKFAFGCASVFGILSKNYLDFMINGVVIVGQLPKSYEQFGIIPGVHMIECSPQETAKKIKDLKRDKNKKMVEQIRTEAYNFAKDKYTSRASLKNFITSIMSAVKNLV